MGTFLLGKTNLNWEVDAKRRQEAEKGEVIVVVVKQRKEEDEIDELPAGWVGVIQLVKAKINEEEVGGGIR